MPSDRERSALTHIQHNIALAMSFVDGLTYEQFRDEFKSFYAVTRALEIISEASRKLSPELKSRHPGIPWKDMAGAGSVYRHDYEDVIQQRVWKTVFEALPPLLAVVGDELAAGDDAL
jgi:uncharacterized protein with HEPN domain